MRRDRDARGMRMLLALALVLPTAGCFERSLEGCDPVDGEGNWVAIRPIWNGTGAPATDACVTAQREGVTLQARPDDAGIAILHLADGAWDLVATVPQEDDPLCANQGFRRLDVTGSADVVVRVEPTIVLCA